MGCGLSQAQLAAIGIEPWPLDGVQALACLWERFHPAARTLPDLDALADATGLAGATTAEEAGQAVVFHRALGTEAAGSGTLPSHYGAEGRASNRGGCLRPRGG